MRPIEFAIAFIALLVAVVLLDSAGLRLVSTILWAAGSIGLLLLLCSEADADRCIRRDLARYERSIGTPEAEIRRLDAETRAWQAAQRRGGER